MTHRNETQIDYLLSGLRLIETFHGLQNKETMAAERETEEEEEEEGVSGLEM